MIPIILATLAVTFIFVTIAGIHEAVERLHKLLNNVRKDLNNKN
jgi:hypothetical protein